MTNKKNGRSVAVTIADRQPRVRGEKDYRRDTRRGARASFSGLTKVVVNLAWE